MFDSVAFWIVTITVAGVAIYAAVRIVRYGGNAAWPTVVGRIESYGKIRHLDDHGTSSLSFMDVSYSYSVDGEYYSGQWLTATLPNDSALMEFLAKVAPLGQALTISYDPKHPERSLPTDPPQPERADTPIQLGL